MGNGELKSHCSEGEPSADMLPRQGSRTCGCEVKPVPDLWPGWSPCLGSHARVSLGEAADALARGADWKGYTATRYNPVAPSRCAPTASLPVSSRGGSAKAALLLHETWVLLSCDLSAALAFLPHPCASRSPLTSPTLSPDACAVG